MLILGRLDINNQNACGELEKVQKCLIQCYSFLHFAVETLGPWGPQLKLLATESSGAQNRKEVPTSRENKKKIYRWIVEWHVIHLIHRLTVLSSPYRFDRFNDGTIDIDSLSQHWCDNNKDSKFNTFRCPRFRSNFASYFKKSHVNSLVRL